MRVRIISAAAALAGLYCLLFLLPEWTIPAAASVLSALAVREFLGATGFVKNRAVLICAAAFSTTVAPWVYAGSPSAAAGVVLMGYASLLFALALGSRRQVTLEQLGGAFFASVFIPLGISAVLRIRMAEAGEYLVVLPMTVTVACDSCAFFVGRSVGHTKMAPDISPHKTWEGAVGGLLGGVAAVLLFGLVMAKGFGYTVNWGFLVFTGALGSLAAEFGDLCFSYIKRQFALKDYSHLIPGHGGILDRLDSLIFAAPLCELMLMLARGGLLWK